MKHAQHGQRRAGLTMVELICALGILAVLMVLVFKLIERTLTVWRTSETRQSVLEQASSVGDLFAHDLRGLENGAQGDVVLEWVRFDTDGDGVLESKWPRLRLVRAASSAEVARLTEQQRRANGEPQTGEAQSGGVQARVLRASQGLVEVIWLVAPASLTDPDARAEGILWRGERLVDDPATKSFFAPDFLGSSGRPPAGATEELTTGILWMRVLCAAQTSVVHDGWKLGNEPADATAAWDAWGKQRPDASSVGWNQVHPGIVVANGRPALPRRVRLELEVERASDRLRRTRLVQIVDSADARIAVDDGERLPAPGSAILIDSEWMELGAVSGDSAAVKRAVRGTTARSHTAGALVHFGAPLAREVVVSTARENWNP
ncbi:MAG: prepilin-type N-terminal cleavage/methylation domain-containing protein [Planctomycetes bacterium]|nr:prepilin-type N-terminal cleavage/methylation domain-containing protein [Planctomycetota bacterium]